MFLSMAAEKFLSMAGEKWKINNGRQPESGRMPRSQTRGAVCSEGLGNFPTRRNSRFRQCRRPLFRAFVYTKALLAKEETAIIGQGLFRQFCW